MATVGIDVVLTGDDPSALAKRHEVGRQQQLTQQCFQSGLLAGASASWSYDRHVRENYTEGNSRICRSGGTYAPVCMPRMKNGMPAALHWSRSHAPNQPPWADSAQASTDYIHRRRPPISLMRGNRQAVSPAQAGVREKRTQTIPLRPVHACPPNVGQSTPDFRR